MKAFNFYRGETAYEEVDIVIDSPVDFPKASKNARKVKLGTLSVTVISPKDLLKMKKYSGRGKDMDDIRVLNILQEK